MPLLFLKSALLFNLIQYSLVSSDEIRSRDKLESFSLQTPSAPRFLGFRLSSFEWNQTPLLESEARYLSIHERAENFSIMRTDPRYPVKFSSLISRSQGLKVPVGENYYFKMDGGFPFRNHFFIGYGLVGGLSSQHTDAWYLLERLYLEARWRKFVVSIGRKPLFWGQSTFAPLLFSDNAKSLDSFQIQTLPLQLPFLKMLGSFKAEAFVSRMNASRTPSNDSFAGWRLGWSPAVWAEFNFAMIYEFGGDGVPGGSALDAFYETLGARGDKGPGTEDSSNVTNRAFEFDFRLRFAQFLIPLSVYGENHVEDCCGSLQHILKTSFAYLYGLHLMPSLQDQIWMEYARTANALYYHSVWPSNASNDGLLFGNPLGANAQSVKSRWKKNWRVYRLQNSIYAFWEERLRAASVVKQPITDIFPGYQTSEKRVGLIPAMGWNFIDDQFIDASLGIVKIWNRENQSGRSAWGWGASLGYRWVMKNE